MSNVASEAINDAVGSTSAADQPSVAAASILSQGPDLAASAIAIASAMEGFIVCPTPAIENEFVLMILPQNALKVFDPEHKMIVASANLAADEIEAEGKTNLQVDPSAVSSAAVRR